MIKIKIHPRNISNSKVRKLFHELYHGKQYNYKEREKIIQNKENGKRVATMTFDNIKRIENLKRFYDYLFIQVNAIPERKNLEKVLIQIEYDEDNVDGDEE